MKDSLPNFPVKGDGDEPVAIVVGDVVTLNSGGPSMTVEKLGGGEGNCGASCVWFDPDGVPQSHHFLSAAIFKTADAPPPVASTKAKPDIHA